MKRHKDNKKIPLWKLILYPIIIVFIISLFSGNGSNKSSTYVVPYKIQKCIKHYQNIFSKSYSDAYYICTVLTKY